MDKLSKFSKAKMKDLIEQFCSITGADHDTGQALLEACDGNLELAVNMHMEGGGVSTAAAAGTSDEDAVRAPIPQTEEMLVEDGAQYAANFRGKKRKNQSVFDGFRDFQEEARQQEAALQAGASGSRVSKKTKTLQDLFRPPIDLTYKGTFYSARDTGRSQGKWLMVNIQNVQEFSCQALNRDIWSNAQVKTLVKDNFIFWQVYHDSEEGQKYCQFYKVDAWPYVAVLDPQTGENLVTWTKLEPNTFCDLMSEFLGQHPTMDSLSPTTKRSESSIVDATEDDQLQAAITASLTEVVKPPVPPTHSPGCPNSDSSELNSDLETFSDSDQTPPASPKKSPKKSTAASASPKTRSRSNTPELRRSPRRHADNSPPPSGKNDTDTTSAAKQKTKRCLSPLARDCDKSDGVVPKRGGSPSSQPCCAAAVRKQSPSRHTSSPLKSASPKKRASVQNSVHPAVLQNKSSSFDEPGTSKETEPSVDVKDGVTNCESDMSVDEPCQAAGADSQDYIAYLGKDSDEKTTLMLRLPNGQRERLSIPFSSKLLAVVLFVGSKGFSQERYELVAHFPHRQLSSLDVHASLADIGLNAQETIFVQKKT